MRVVVRLLARFLMTLAFAGIFGWVLVRLAPGFGVDERELDTRLSAESIAALQAGKPLPSGFDYAFRFLRGDWGNSETYGNIPVTQLLRERWPTTAISVTAAMAMAWIAAILLAGGSAMFRWVDRLASATSFALLALPSGLVAVAIFLAGAPVAAGIAVAVFPPAFRYIRQLTLDALEQPCVFAAAARGVSRFTVLTRHAGALIRPQTISLLGASAAMAVGAAIPMEAICDSPGLGQLAWKAAQARDLPTLMPLILLITAAIQGANLLTEVQALGEPRT